MRASARTAAAAVLIALALSPQPGPAQAPPALAAIVDGVAAERMAKDHAPGMAIAVFEHGAVAYAHGYGFADVGRRIPVTVDTRFEIGSITKQLTAACIMQQVRAGKLSLDDPIGKFVPEYAAARAVTVRQMLSHTSGLPEYAFYGAHNPSTLPAILALVMKRPMMFKAGTHFSYSNTNYVLLGRILELTSGEPYEQYVREHIFAPAHMEQSGFTSDAATIPDMAVGYQESGAVGPPMEGNGAVGAAGNVVSTVGDMVKWDQALGSGAIVTPADLALMQTPVRVNDGSTRPYGFGFGIDAVGGHPVFSHNGGTDGFAATNAMFPRDGESIVVLENLALASPARVSAAIFAAEHPDVTAKFDTSVPGEDPAITARVREIVRRAAIGQPDRSQFSERFRKMLLNRDSIAFARDEFAPLGPATRFIFRGKSVQPATPRTPAMTWYEYDIAFGSDQESIDIGIDAQNKVTAMSFGRYRDAPPVFDAKAKEDFAVTAALVDWLHRLATGSIDRTRLTASFSAFFTASMAAQTQKDIARLGAMKTIRFRGRSEGGSVPMNRYDATFQKGALNVLIALDAQGQITAFAYGTVR